MLLACLLWQAAQAEAAQGFPHLAEEQLIAASQLSGLQAAVNINLLW